MRQAHFMLALFCRAESNRFYLPNASVQLRPGFLAKWIEFIIHKQQNNDGDDWLIERVLGRHKSLVKPKKSILRGGGGNILQPEDEIQHSQMNLLEAPIEEADEEEEKKQLDEEEVPEVVRRLFDDNREERIKKMMALYEKKRRQREKQASHNSDSPRMGE